MSQIAPAFGESGIRLSCGVGTCRRVPALLRGRSPAGTAAPSPRLVLAVQNGIHSNIHHDYVSLLWHLIPAVALETIQL